MALQIATSSRASESCVALVTFQRFDGVFDPFAGERYHYAASGYLERVQEAKYGPAGEVYLEVLAMDARGNVTRQVLGNGVVTDRDYNSTNGQLEWIGSAHGLNTHLQHLTYVWDAHGNLTRRHDISNGWNVQEDFGYDDLNRLDHRAPDRTGPEQPPGREHRLPRRRRNRSILAVLPRAGVAG